MQSPFSKGEIAAGYATSRPPVHPRVIEQVYRSLERTGPFRHVLDVGCGAGVSTKALEGVALRRTGLEPVEAMLRWTATVAPRADFIVGKAEAIPFRDRSADAITAAGSLNYADLDLFFPEAARVLEPEGVLIVYDFQPGRTFRHSDLLDRWFSEFVRRYPAQPNEARLLNPEVLAALDSGFLLRNGESFEIPLTLAPGFYLDYIMTETNVAAAEQRGVPRAEIRSWCSETLAPLWDGKDREVLFRGYFACMNRRI